MGPFTESTLECERAPTGAVARISNQALIDTVLFAALLLLSIAPIWWFRYFPSQDGPVHLENAAILREYYDPERPLLREFYTINTYPDPNWLGHLLLAGLMYVVPILIAEKILLTGYLILLPLSLRYALKALRSDPRFLTLLAFPFVPNLFFHMGFHNFCYSLPLFFFVVGYWLKHQNEFTGRRIGGLMLLGLILYFGHLVSLVAAWVLISVQILWLTYLDWKTKPAGGQGGPWQPGKAFWPRVLPTFLAFLPSLLLALWFLRRQGWAARAAENPGEHSWSILLRLEALVSYYSISEALISVVLSGFFGVLTLYLLAPRLKSWKPAPGDGLLLGAVAFVALYLFTPAAMSGGSFINYRLTLYPFFTLMLWFATQQAIQRARWAIRAAAVVATLAMLGFHSQAYAQTNDYLEEILAVSDAIEPNRTLLPLSFSPAGVGPDGKPLSVRVVPFLHAAGYIAAARHVVNLKNYEATTGYFPMLYRPEMNPYQWMGKDDSVQDHGLHLVPPRVDFLKYAEKTHQPVDYVLIWGLRPEQRSNKWTTAIFLQLETGGYEPVAVPAGRGFAQLYRRKGHE